MGGRTSARAATAAAPSTVPTSVGCCRCTSPIATRGSSAHLRRLHRRRDRPLHRGERRGCARGGCSSTSRHRARQPSRDGTGRSSRARSTARSRTPSRSTAARSSTPSSRTPSASSAWRARVSRAPGRCSSAPITPPPACGRRLQIRRCRGAPASARRASMSSGSPRASAIRPRRSAGADSPPARRRLRVRRAGRQVRRAGDLRERVRPRRTRRRGRAGAPGARARAAGRLCRQADRQQGVDLLIAAWPLVLQRAPEARLVVVGFGATGRARAAAKACSTRLERRGRSRSGRALEDERIGRRALSVGVPGESARW